MLRLSLAWRVTLVVAFSFLPQVLGGGLRPIDGTVCRLNGG